MKKPSKTAAELEASIKVEMEDICDWPTDLMISVQPDGDSWKVAVVQEGSGDDADRREMVEQIAARLKGEGLTSPISLNCDFQITLRDAPTSKMTSCGKDARPASSDRKHLSTPSL